MIMCNYLGPAFLTISLLGLIGCDSGDTDRISFQLVEVRESQTGGPGNVEFVLLNEGASITSASAQATFTRSDTVVASSPIAGLAADGIPRGVEFTLAVQGPPFSMFDCIDYEIRAGGGGDEAEIAGTECL